MRTVAPEPAQVVDPTVRKRQSRADETRTAILDAALIEFGAHGFEGASTRSIATRARTHQPQINYHFESKEALWHEAVDHLFHRLDALVDEHSEGIGSALLASPGKGTKRTYDEDDARRGFALLINGLVRAVAQLPELNRIMVQESTVNSARLEWIVRRHTRTRHRALLRLWKHMRELGVARDIDGPVFYYTLIGAASLPYVAAPEARLLGHAAMSEKFIRTHIDALLSMFLKETVHG